MTAPKVTPAQVEALKAALEKVDTLDLPTAAEFRGEGWGDEAALAFALAIGLAPLLLAEREELLAQRNRLAAMVVAGCDHTDLCAVTSREGECHCGYDARLAEARAMLEAER